MVASYYIRHKNQFSSELSFTTSKLKSVWQKVWYTKKNKNFGQEWENGLGFYACGIQIGCIESIERHAFWLAKPSGASHIRNSMHVGMFRSSGVHDGQNSFKYWQNNITYNSLIVLGNFYNFMVRITKRPLHLCRRKIPLKIFDGRY